MPAEFVPSAPAPKVDTPVVPAGPTQADLDSAVAAERAKTEAERIKLEAEKGVYSERLQMLETILSDRMRGKTPPPEIPITPTVTDEDFLTPDGARKAAERLAEEKAMQVGKAIDANYRQTMTQMLEDQFDSKLEALKTRPYFKYIEKDLEDALKKNPNIRLAPRALDILYNSFVGARGQEIVEAEKKVERDTVANQDVNAGSVVREGVPRGSVRAPEAPRRESKTAGPVLTEREEEIRASFARFLPKDHLSQERWEQLREERGMSRKDIPVMANGDRSRG